MLREDIPIMKLLKDLKKAGFPIESTMPKLMYKAFEDNSGALDMATVHKHIARTNNINVKLHHFRDSVTCGEVTIPTIGTLDQAFDYLTKEFNQSTLGRHSFTIQGW